MAETRGKTQLPIPEITTPRIGDDVEVFERGLRAGRELAETAVRRIGAWAEENPGQVVLAGLALGFVLGKLLLGRRRTLSEELE
jgi:hypothetical protein